MSFRLAWGGVEGHPNYTGGMAVKDRMAEATDGAITVETFPGAVLGSEAQTFEMNRTNTLEASIVNTSIVVGVLPELGVINLPYLFRDRDHAINVLSGDIGQRLMAGLKDFSIVPLAVWSGATREVATDRPISAYSDFKGLKVRSSSNTVTVSFVESLGAVPISMGWTDVYTSAKTGLINGTETAVTSLYTDHIYEVLPYDINLAYNHGSYTVTASGAWFNSLSDTNQEVILEVFDSVGKNEHYKANEDMHAEVYDNLAEAGATIVEVNDLDAYVAAAEKFYEDMWYPEFTEELIDEIRNIK